MTTTALNLIRRAMLLIGAVATGESPSAEESQDGLSTLNEMLSAWNTQRLMTYQVGRYTFNLIAGQQDYSVGSGGGWSPTRLVKVEAAWLRATSLTPVQEWPLELVDLDKWALISEKSTQSPYPQLLYYETSYPLAAAHVWPVPSQINAVILDAWVPLTSVANLTTSIDLPPGYERALRYNLAVEMAPEYGKGALDPTVVALANASKNDVRRLNLSSPIAQLDPALSRGGGAYNIFTDSSL